MREKKTEAEKLRRIFRVLQAALGPQHWWPAASAFEMVVGAYLTQNTAWTNVELAMGNLRAAGVLTVSGIDALALEELERLVRPAGYFRQKAARLKAFVAHLNAHYGGSLEAMLRRPLAELREELLGLAGIGPETADAILLYAANREVFVVDAYTRRILQRHGLAPAGTGYEEIRAAVEAALGEAGIGGQEPEAQGQESRRRMGHTERPSERHTGHQRPTPHAPSALSAGERSEIAQRYNEFHALLVQTAKHYCVKGEPRCQSCPLRGLLPGGLPPER